MKKNGKHIILVMIVALSVLWIGYLFGGTELIASENDGKTSASEQQQSAEKIKSIEVRQQEEAELHPL